MDTIENKIRYDDKYTQGYMEEWSPEKTAKITWILQTLDLPEQGDLLDFGCGNGVLTEVIRTLLPHWKVHGTDISDTAIDNARRWFPECLFFKQDDPGFREKKFDFVFSHHVFEHVEDLPAVFAHMTNFLAEDARMLHCLPCGNEGSFEYNLCLLQKNGIDRSQGGRFFFEGEEHVRRLTSDDFTHMAEERQCVPKRAFYANQFYGAIEMITSSHPHLVLKMTRGTQAVNLSARFKLLKLRMVLLFLNLWRMPALIVHHFMAKRNKQAKHFILLALAVPLYPISRPLDAYLKHARRQEFEQRHHERNGSEMCLSFERKKTP